MVRCARCGSGFSALHSAAEVSCPRCRIRDGVTADFLPTRSRKTALTATDSLPEMTRSLERGRARLGVNIHTSV